MHRTRGSTGDCLREAAIILVKYGEEESVKEAMLEYFNPKYPLESSHLKDVVEIIESLQIMGKDLDATG